MTSGRSISSADTETRLTLDDRGTEIDPVLLRGGRTLIFSATTAGGPPQLFRKNLDTGEDEAVLPPVPEFREAYDVSPDDRMLVYGEQRRIRESLVDRAA